MKNKKLLTLVECAILIALSFILSLLKIPQVFGGSVTVCSMVPLMIISYRRGPKWGLASAFVFSAIKLVMGLENYSYATGAASIIAITLFDYLLAYTSVALAGFIRPYSEDSRKKKITKTLIGSIAAMMIRYALHVISGAVVWYDLTKIWEEGDPSNMVFRYSKWVYSIIYNGIYMIPETIITAAVMVVLVLTMKKYMCQKKNPD